ncbi:MAG: MBL fold metallo-hydrolase [Bacilli bacterium]|jgi:beta-lactamase superfamily II metal-dependent hydrolase
MKRIPLFLLLLLLVLSSCGPHDNSSSSNTDGSSSSETNQGYAERIATMADTGVAIGSDDKTDAQNATYDSQAPLGSASHPLSNSSFDYLEIVVFEQPIEVGDAYLFKVGDATIVMDFGNYASSSFSDSSTYYNLLKNTYDAYLDDGHLDLLILTHPHSDHYGGYLALRAAVSSIDMIVDYGYYEYGGENYRTNIRDYYVGQDSEYHRIYDMVNGTNGGMKRTYVTSEVFIDWLDTGYYSTNYNDGPVVDDLNVTCVTGILSYRNFTYFFSGDLQDNPSGYYGGTGGSGETRLVQTNATNTDVFHTVTMMKAPHHGSSKASNNVLLNVLQPKLVTISAGAPFADTSYGGSTGVCAGHPHYQTLDRYLTKGAKRTVPKIYLNFVNGTTSFVTDGLSKVYMEGSPLRTNYEGTSYRGSITNNYGSTTDRYSDIQSTSWGQVCHGL